MQGLQSGTVFLESGPGWGVGAGGGGEAFENILAPKSNIELVFLRIGGTCHIPLESHRVERAGWGAQVYGKGKMHCIEMLLEVRVDGEREA